jgi:hypothetical protein
MYVCTYVAFQAQTKTEPKRRKIYFWAGKSEAVFCYLLFCVWKGGGFDVREFFLPPKKTFFLLIRVKGGIFFRLYLKFWENFSRGWTYTFG